MYVHSYKDTEQKLNTKHEIRNTKQKTVYCFGSLIFKNFCQPCGVVVKHISLWSL